jgi:hypothetical protein
MQIDPNQFARIVEAGEKAAQELGQAQAQIKMLRSTIQNIIDGCVHPEIAVRRVSIELAPLRKVLKETV